MYPKLRVSPCPVISGPNGSETQKPIPFPAPPAGVIVISSIQPVSEPEFTLPSLEYFQVSVLADAGKVNV